MNYNILFETYILFLLCCRFQILIIKIIEKILAYQKIHFKKHIKTKKIIKS